MPPVSNGMMKVPFSLASISLWLVYIYFEIMSKSKCDALHYCELQVNWPFALHCKRPWADSSPTGAAQGCLSRYCSHRRSESKFDGPSSLKSGFSFKPGRSQPCSHPACLLTADASLAAGQEAADQNGLPSGSETPGSGSSQEEVWLT